MRDGSRQREECTTDFEDGSVQVQLQGGPQLIGLKQVLEEIQAGGKQRVSLSEIPQVQDGYRQLSHVALHSAGKTR